MIDKGRVCNVICSPVFPLQSYPEMIKHIDNIICDMACIYGVCTGGLNSMIMKEGSVDAPQVLTGVPR